MKILYSISFEKRYRKLPVRVQISVEEKTYLFKNDPHYPNLRTHKLHGKMKNFWAFSVNYDYRVIFKFENKQLIKFIDIGKHNIYE